MAGSSNDCSVGARRRRATLYIIPLMSGMPPPPPAAFLLGHLGDDRLGGEDVLGDRRRVLQRRAGDHRGVDDARGDEIDDLVGGRVQALAFLGLAHVVDDDRALEAGVLGELAQRLLERPQHDPRAGALVVDPSTCRRPLTADGGLQQRDAAAGHDALLERRAGGLQRVLDAVLLLLHLRLGGRADLDHGDAAGELGQALLELLAVEVRVGVLDFGFDLVDAAFDRLRRHRRRRRSWWCPWPRPRDGRGRAGRPGCSRASGPSPR